MPSPLPSDEVLLEQTVAGAIKDTILSVPIIAANVNVYVQERYPDNEDQAIELATVPDPVVGDNVLRTSIIELGIPTVEEYEYTGDHSTYLKFTYPITFHYDVVDAWKDPNNVLEFKSSRALVMAIYMRARRAFKFNRDLGFQNCVHEYLQQVDASTLTDDDTGGRLHTAEWALTVKVTGVLV